MNMNRFFVVTNRPKDEDLKITNEILGFLHKNGAVCDHLCLEDAQNELGGQNKNPLGIDEKTECILVIGGDGTLLQVAQATLHLDIPLLGINYGTLGALAEVEKDNLKEALTALLTKELQTEARMMLSGRIVVGDKMQEDDYALNDIVLTREGSLKILNLDIYVNGQFFHRYCADGVIVSTPTGSTGYNLSAGGPIVEPRAELMLITPVCPHSFNSRSVILSAADQVQVRIPMGKNGKPQRVEVNFDGNRKEILQTGDCVQIEKASKVTKFVRISQTSFLEMLYQKMSE
ncbi:MAG: NAD(+)/NADH kinase [Lachnospiraceae bacterium]|nr:NAD(+)/NADH kinase [Lachnospiraceae bacterium]